MANKSSSKSDFRGLEVLATSLKKMDDGKYRIQVGIFGDKNARPEDKNSDVTNAEVGFRNEMGVVSKRIPRRSFLWDTFELHFAELETAIKDAKLLEKYFLIGKIDEYLKKVSIACTNLVDEAFTSSGWGSWRPISARTLAERKTRSVGSTLPLLDTGQLRQSISARVVKS